MFPSIPLLKQHCIHNHWLILHPRARISQKYFLFSFCPAHQFLPAWAAALCMTVLIIFFPKKNRKWRVLRKYFYWHKPSFSSSHGPYYFQLNQQLFSAQNTSLRLGRSFESKNSAMSRPIFRVALHIQEVPSGLMWNPSLYIREPHQLARSWMRTNARVYILIF
jgi:hypothetical protein